MSFFTDEDGTDYPDASIVDVAMANPGAGPGLVKLLIASAEWHIERNLDGPADLMHDLRAVSALPGIPEDLRSACGVLHARLTN